MAAAQAHSGGEDVPLIQMAACIQPMEFTESEKKWDIVREEGCQYCNYGRMAVISAKEVRGWDGRHTEGVHIGLGHIDVECKPAIEF